MNRRALATPTRPMVAAAGQLGARVIAALFPTERLVPVLRRIPATSRPTVRPAPPR